MRKLLEDMFYKDLEDIEKESKKYNGKSYSKIEKDLKAHSKFWNSLNETQKQQFAQYERITAEENSSFNKEIYVYAFKKALNLFLSAYISF